MKWTIRIFICVAAMLFACNHNSERIYKYPSNQYLGFVPSLVAEFADVDSVLNVNEKNFKRQNKSISDVENFNIEQKQKRDKIFTELALGISEIRDSIIGKSVPAVSEIPELEISEMEIVDIDSFGNILLKGKIKATKPFLMSKYLGTAIVYCESRDTAGNVIGEPVAQTITNPNYALPDDNVGENFEVKKHLKISVNPKHWLKFGAVVFVPDKKRN